VARASLDAYAAPGREKLVSLTEKGVVCYAECASPSEEQE